MYIKQNTFFHTRVCVYVLEDGDLNLYINTNMGHGG